MSAVYSIYTSPNHAPIPNHLPTLIVTPHGQPHHTLYSYIHTNYNKETYLLTPSPQGDLCVAKMVPPPGSRGPRSPGQSSDPAQGDPTRDRSVRCEASRNLKWSITNTGIHAPVYKLTLPNPDQPGTEQPLFQISKPNPKAAFWSMFYFTYAGHLIPPKRVEFGKIQKNAAAGANSASGGSSGGSGGGGGGTRVTITGKSAEEKAVWQTLGEGNEDMVEWIVLCAALNVLDDEILKAAEKHNAGAQASSPTAGPSKVAPYAVNGNARPGARIPVSPQPPQQQQGGSRPGLLPGAARPGASIPPHQYQQQQPQQQQRPNGMPVPPAIRSGMGNVSQRPGPPMQQQQQQQQRGQPMPQGRGMPMNGGPPGGGGGQRPLPGAAMPAPGGRRY
ncbi:unnamed protein product [Tilletia controversa]|uniref:Uncharacterized protein n=3 Tax=Tilletia TaxID=13289 RepID=A0A8X7SWX9_9BASI|nr:hypothetical protein CF328_g3599 [Tilletia controversa]KAE8207277.1 hypothetical protein CF335_g1258 [Tilletia laevis]KAE8260304.1 hypothetical protein A4X03_0g3851 [Tilletia caries]KAE8247592.1 hypothetical protein A4X06_0g4336 [Tilletia controversa]CAD6890289.1 unnamed protein product [Tilletia caries]